MDRTEIIRSLNVEYQKGLPDIPKDSSGYLQESTNTLMCFGNCVTTVSYTHLTLPTNSLV